MIEYKKKPEELKEKEIIDEEEDKHFEKKEFTNTAEEELEKEIDKVKYKEGHEEE